MINNKHFDDNVKRYFEVFFCLNDTFLINVFFRYCVDKYYEIATID